MLVNILCSLTVFYEYILPQILKKWAKPYLKIFFEKVFKFFGLKLRIFWTLIVLKISWLATWFIFELMRVGDAPDLNETQAFINLSLQIMIHKTFTFCGIFHKKLHHNQGFDVWYEWPKRKRFPFTTSSFRFYENLQFLSLSFPHPWFEHSFKRLNVLCNRCLQTFIEFFIFFNSNWQLFKHGDISLYH